MGNDFEIGVSLYSIAGLGGHIEVYTKGNGDYAGYGRYYNGLPTDSNGNTVGAAAFLPGYNLYAYTDRQLNQKAVFTKTLGSYTYSDFQTKLSALNLAVEAINAQNLKYDFSAQSGPNSNSVARTLLEAIGIAPGVSFFTKYKVVPGYSKLLVDQDYLEDLANQCFPFATPILTPSGTTSISHIRTGDTILAFDPAANFGRGALVEKRVTKLFRNTTTEWIELDLGGTDSTTGESNKLTCTPGHHFLDEFGNFPTIAELLLRGGGKAKIVLEDGALHEVSGKRIMWSEATADLYGGRALRRRSVQTLRSARQLRLTHLHNGRVLAAVLSAKAAKRCRASG